MTRPGTEQFPLRVAIVGSGPAGFYAAEHLFKQSDMVTHIDMFDRLPTPFGLVRGGVAPDHQKIKNVTRVFDRIAQRDEFRFFGNVEVGRDLTIEDLRQYFHAVIIATGAQQDRALGIPGEDLEGSHSATEFVAWYNGHPDYRDHTFDLSATDVVIVGVGNVAIDVARILCRTVEELKSTDIADYALDALRHSRVRNIYMLGRRGPAQAAFTNPEIRELGDMVDADVVLNAEDFKFDSASRKMLETADREMQKKLEILNTLLERESRQTRKRLHLRFCISPRDVLGDSHGKVRGVRVVRNRLELQHGRIRPVPTDETEEIPAQLLFRSIGYRGVPVPGLPFEESSGTIPNVQGRVVDSVTKSPLTGTYVAGWIKRGPSGVIGTNKPDSVETSEQILSDLQHGRLLAPSFPDRAAFDDMMRERQLQYFSYEDWLCIDSHELAQGEAAGRPRVKLTCVEDMLEAVRRSRRNSGSSD